MSNYFLAKKTNVKALTATTLSFGVDPYFKASTQIGYFELNIHSFLALPELTFKIFHQLEDF